MSPTSSPSHTLVLGDRPMTASGHHTDTGIDTSIDTTVDTLQHLHQKVDMLLAQAMAREARSDPVTSKSILTSTSTAAATSSLLPTVSDELLKKHHQDIMTAIGHQLSSFAPLSLAIQRHHQDRDTLWEEKMRTSVQAAQHVGLNREVLQLRHTLNAYETAFNCVSTIVVRSSSGHSANGSAAEAMLKDLPLMFHEHQQLKATLAAAQSDQQRRDEQHKADKLEIARLAGLLEERTRLSQELQWRFDHRGVPWPTAKLQKPLPSVPRRTAARERAVVGGNVNGTTSPLLPAIRFAEQTKGPNGVGSVSGMTSPDETRQECDGGDDHEPLLQQNHRQQQQQQRILPRLSIPLISQSVDGKFRPTSLSIDRDMLDTPIPHASCVQPLTPTPRSVVSPSLTAKRKSSHMQMQMQIGARA